MYNLSTQELVLSIEKSPLLEKHGIVYQEYTNFFDIMIQKSLSKYIFLTFDIGSKNFTQSKIFNNI